MSSAQVRVLVVDDSAVSRELLTGLFNADPALQVVGLAADGEAAVAAIAATLNQCVRRSEA